MFRFRLQPILCTIVNVVNGMVSGQRSTLGTGLSGEPRTIICELKSVHISYLRINIDKKTMLQSFQFSTHVSKLQTTQAKESLFPSNLAWTIQLATCDEMIPVKNHSWMVWVLILAFPCFIKYLVLMDIVVRVMAPPIQIGELICVYKICRPSKPYARPYVYIYIHCIYRHVTCLFKL